MVLVGETAGTATTSALGQGQPQENSQSWARADLGWILGKVLPPGSAGALQGMVTFPNLPEPQERLDTAPGWDFGCPRAWIHDPCWMDDPFQPRTFHDPVVF